MVMLALNQTHVSQVFAREAIQRPALLRTSAIQQEVAIQARVSARVLQKPMEQLVMTGMPALNQTHASQVFAREAIQRPALLRTSAIQQEVAIQARVSARVLQKPMEQLVMTGIPARNQIPAKRGFV
jgi:hypothetical protein